MHTAVKKVLGVVVEQRLSFILLEALAVNLIGNLDLVAAHWTVKKGKPSGYTIGDVAHIDGTSLNSDYTTNEAASCYGSSNNRGHRENGPEVLGPGTRKRSRGQMGGYPTVVKGHIPSYLSGPRMPACLGWNLRVT